MAVTCSSGGSGEDGGPLKLFSKGFQIKGNEEMP
jgi:hypothetical protein